MAKSQKEMAATAEAIHSDSGPRDQRLLGCDPPNNYRSIANGRPGSRSQSPTSPTACNSGSPYVYEEFDSKLQSLTCPTCSGTGKLTKEQEHDLVALIPVRDTRLKPRRTKLYLFIAIVLCLALSTTVAVLLFPREIAVKIIAAEACNISIPKTNVSEPWIMFKTTYEISNSNFVTAKLSDLTAQVIWDKFVVSNTVMDSFQVSADARSTKQFTVFFNTTYPGLEGKKIRRLCGPFGWHYNLLFIISSTAKVSSLTHSEDTSQTRYQYVICNSDDWFDGVQRPLLAHQDTTRNR